MNYLHQKTVIGNISLMGFNKRKLEDQRRREAADKEAANATDALVLEDAERLIAVWNEGGGRPDSARQVQVINVRNNRLL